MTAKNQKNRRVVEFGDFQRRVSLRTRYAIFCLPRSGVKHDCVKIMEFIRRDGALVSSRFFSASAGGCCRGRFGI